MSIRIVNSEEHLYPKDWSWSNHHHDELYQMFYIIDGEAVFSIDNVEYRTRPGDILLVNPGMLHCMSKGITAVTTQEVFFELDEGFLKNLIEKKNRFKYSNDSIKPLMDFFVKISSSRNADYISCAQSCLISILAMIFAKDDVLNYEIINGGFIDNKEFSSITKHALNYIDRNFYKNLSLDKISYEIGCNKSYLCTLFKKETSMTINTYVNAVRIHHAADLLSFSIGGIETVYSIVGFSSVEQFNKKFKEYIGVPPRTYKKFSSVNINYDRIVRESSMSDSIINAVASRVGNFG